jgi:hypothetical protein
MYLCKVLSSNLFCKENVCVQIPSGRDSENMMGMISVMIEELGLGRVIGLATVSEQPPHGNQ